MKLEIRVPARINIAILVVLILVGMWGWAIVQVGCLVYFWDQLEW